MKKLLAALATGLLLTLSCAGPQKVNEPLLMESTSTTSKVINIQGDFYEGTFNNFINETLDPRIKHYTIVINSDGGDAFACTGMMSRILELKSYGVKFTTVTYTKAYSAGFFIYMMGDERLATKNAQFMVHTMDAQQAYDGNDAQERFGPEKWESIWRIEEWVIREAFLAMSYMDPLLLETMLLNSGATFFDTTEAYEFGLVTKIIS